LTGGEITVIARGGTTAYVNGGILNGHAEFGTLNIVSVGSNPLLINDLYCTTCKVTATADITVMSKPGQYNVPATIQTTRGNLTLRTTGDGSSINLLGSIEVAGSAIVKADKGTVSSTFNRTLRTEKGSLSVTAGTGIYWGAYADIATSATLKTTGLGSDISIDGLINTRKGNISVSGHAQQISINGNLVAAGTSAAVLVRNTNKLDGLISINGGLIAVGKLSARVTVAIGTAAALQKGPLPVMNYTLNSQPVAPSSPPFYFGPNGITASTGATAEVAGNGRVSFNTGTANASAIQFNGGVSALQIPVGLVEPRYTDDFVVDTERDDCTLEEYALEHSGQ
jgi:hypothetical protein